MTDELGWLKTRSRPVLGAGWFERQPRHADGCHLRGEL